MKPDADNAVDLVDTKTIRVALFFPTAGAHEYRLPWPATIVSRYRTRGGERLVVEVDAGEWHRYRARRIREEHCIDVDA